MHENVFPYAGWLDADVVRTTPTAYVALAPTRLDHSSRRRSISNGGTLPLAMVATSATALRLFDGLAMLAAISSAQAMSPALATLNASSTAP